MQKARLREPWLQFYNLAEIALYSASFAEVKFSSLPVVSRFEFECQIPDTCRSKIHRWEGGFKLTAAAQFFRARDSNRPLAAGRVPRMQTFNALAERRFAFCGVPLQPSVGHDAA